MVNEILPSGQVLHLEHLTIPSNKQGLEQERKVETSLAAAVELPPAPAPQATEPKEANGTPAKENAPAREGKSGETSQVGEAVHL